MQTTFDGIGLHQLLTSGYLNLKANMDTINGLNVFPVPDGDTGSNMVMTLGGGLRAVNDSTANVGEYMQTPPMYSALKIGGEKLCDLARRGVTVDRQARKITIHSIDAKRISDRVYSLDVHCSKGTYIRTLCADIGAALGCGGLMQALMRTHASVFGLEDSHTLEEIEAMTEEERDRLIIPTERVFEAYEKVTLDPFYSRLARCGVEIYLKKIGKSLGLGETVTLYDKDGFFALGEVREFDAGLAIKPIKQFDV